MVTGRPGGTLEGNGSWAAIYLPVDSNREWHEFVIEFRSISLAEGFGIGTYTTAHSIRTDTQNAHFGSKTKTSRRPEGLVVSGVQGIGRRPETWERIL